ncbi:MAG TPA: DNA recombination protein RmuC [Vicinamibacterales bacterium]|nr:DNA recombination protein RmuC [Vicinamibacterales bacterium]
MTLDWTVGLVATVAAGVGALIGWLLARWRAAELAAVLRAENARLAAELAHRERAIPEQMALVEQMQRQVRDSFEALAAGALQTSSRQFLELADQKLGNVHRAAAAELGQRQQALDALVAPIRETLGQVAQTLSDSDRHRLQDGASLRTLLGAVGQTQQQLQQETQGLIRALRSPGVRGRWGEVQLRKVVELAGMIEHCDFEVQPTAVSDAGRLRPDMVVTLPGDRTIVVDAKVPLEAFLDAQAAADDGVRSGRLADHVRQVKDHLAKLGAKGYWDQFPSSPDFVVLFLPAEAIFMAALEQDAHLIEYGVRQRVLIASPLTLIAMLRTAALAWRQEQLGLNAAEISRLGRELYDRARTFTERLSTLGTRLDLTVRAFNEAVGAYDARVMVSMRKFKELGAATGDAIESPAQVETTARRLESSLQPDLLDHPDAEEDAVGRS